MKSKSYFLSFCLILCLTLSLSLSGCGSLSKQGGLGRHSSDGTGSEESGTEESGTDESSSGGHSGRHQNGGAGSSSSQTPLQDLTGKKLSILGDALSTFDNYIPTDYNIFYPGSGDISTVEKTWWFQVLSATGMELNANASSSNTTITGDPTDTTGSAPAISDKRLGDLTPGDNGASPDVLLVYMGKDDFVKSIPLGSFESPEKQEDTAKDNFCDAFELLIQKLNRFYPNAQVYFCTLLETNAGDSDENPTGYPCTNKNGNTLGDFNAEICTIASAYNYPVIDLHNCGITYDTLSRYTSDGVHPNAEGAGLMAEYITNALLY